MLAAVLCICAVASVVVLDDVCCMIPCARAGDARVRAVTIKPVEAIDGLVPRIRVVRECFMIIPVLDASVNAGMDSR